MRSCFVAGHIGPSRPLTIRPAAFCAWGNHWMTEADRALHDAGAPTTHGCCPECARGFMAQLDAMPAPPPNAA